MEAFRKRVPEPVRFCVSGGLVGGSARVECFHVCVQRSGRACATLPLPCARMHANNCPLPHVRPRVSRETWCSGRSTRGWQQVSADAHIQFARA